MNPHTTPPIVRVDPGATGASPTSNILPIATKTMPSVIPIQMTLINHGLENDERARLCLKRVLADPILCAQLFPEEFSPKGFSFFPKNPQDWLQKEEVVLSNEDLIGPRWTIIWSRFIIPIILKNSGCDDQAFSCGFKVLQSVDHIGNDLIYPFSSLKSLLDKDDFETYNSDQIANFVKIWAKILIFVITGNFSRHPWFDTSSLHGFCNQAAASLPSLCEQYSNLVTANKEILAIKRKYPSGDNETFSSEAEEAIKKEPRLLVLRSKISMNRDSMFRHSDLGLFIYERITKELEEPKLWWPIQLLTKGKRNQLSEDVQVRVVTKGLHRRSKKSRSLSTGGNSLADEEVWYQRLPKTSKIPEYKKEYCTNFESSGKAQHGDEWFEWLKLQEM